MNALCVHSVMPTNRFIQNTPIKSISHIARLIVFFFYFTFASFTGRLSNVFLHKILDTFSMMNSLFLVYFFVFKFFLIFFLFFFSMKATKPNIYNRTKASWLWGNREENHVQFCIKLHALNWIICFLVGEHKTKKKNKILNDKYALSKQFLITLLPLKWHALSMPICRVMHIVLYSVCVFFFVFKQFHYITLMIVCQNCAIHSINCDNHHSHDNFRQF